MTKLDIDATDDYCSLEPGTHVILRKSIWRRIAKDYFLFLAHPSSSLPYLICLDAIVMGGRCGNVSIMLPHEAVSLSLPPSLPISLRLLVIVCVAAGMKA